MRACNPNLEVDSDLRWIYHTKTNIVLFSNLIRYFMKYVTSEHETHIMHLLQSAINKRVAGEILNLIDGMWCSVTRKEDEIDSSERDFEMLCHFYQTLYNDSRLGPDILIAHVMRTGIDQYHV